MGSPVYGAGFHAGVAVGKQLGRQEVMSEIARGIARAIRGAGQLALVVVPVVVRHISNDRDAQRQGAAH